MLEREVRAEEGAMPISSRSHHYLSFPVMQQGQQNADLLSPLLSNTNARASTSLRSLGDHGRNDLEAAICEVKQFFAAIPRTTNTWLDLKVSPFVRDKLVKYFEEDEQFCDCRHDYFLVDHTFSIGMETRTHAVFASSISCRLQTQIEELRKGPCPQLSQFARKILNTSTARIQLELPTPNSHSPDASFTHKDAKYPSFVIEIAHSQRKQSLPLLAHEYICGSNGNIRCVYGLKIPYPTGAQASMSVWEARFDDLGDGRVELRVEQTIEDKIFRTTTGQPSLDFPGLRLFLPHLALADQIAYRQKDISEDLTEIRITGAELCEFLQQAQESETSAKDGQVRGYGNQKLVVKWPEAAPVEEVGGDWVKN